MHAIGDARGAGESQAILDAGTRISRRRFLTVLGFAGVGSAMRPWTAMAAAMPSGETASKPKPGQRLTEEYGVQLPFVGAGMAFVSTPRLVAAVSNSGGIGVLGGSPEPPARLRALIQETKTLTGGLFGVDLIHASGSPTGAVPFTTDEHIEVCVREGVKLVVFFWNDPPPTWVDRLHRAGAKVWMQVGSVGQARAANALGVDGVIAQGSEAGGHVRGSADGTGGLPLSELLPAVRDAVSPTLVLAAGGIAEDHDVTKAFKGGADGVWVGTRLVASEEAHAHSEYKRRIVASDGTDTVVSTMFGPEWQGQPMRVLRNRVVNEWAGREDDIPNPPPPPPVIGTTTLFGLPYAMPKFSAVLPTSDTSGDFEEMAFTAGGVSAAKVKAVMPAGEIVRRLMGEASRTV